MHGHHNSAFHIPSNRHAYVIFMRGALVALAHIILSSQGEPDYRVEGLLAFGKGLNALKTIAPGMRSARETLTGLQRVISAVEKTDLGESADSCWTDPVCRDPGWSSVLPESQESLCMFPTDAASFGFTGPSMSVDFHADDLNFGPLDEFSSDLDWSRS